MATVETNGERRVLVGEIYRSPHLSAADLEGDTVVTIKGFALDQEVGSEKAKKGVLYFEEFSKGMVINKTNAERVRDLHGKYVNDWVGKQVTLYPSETDFGGKTVDCIRVRAKK
jgi:hypothetical protein